MASNELPSLLIVDDEPGLRLLLSEFFKKQFKVTSVEDGNSCLSYLKENNDTQVLIIDLQMPDLSGVEVIKRIRTNPQWNQLAILVLSSAESSQDRIKCLREGADDFVVKPFNPAELEARIQAILRRIKR